MLKHCVPSVIVKRLALAAMALLPAACAKADVSLFMEEPFGTFGAFNPTGHAAVYLDGICAETPTRLRLCRPGEQGVVISRYHHVAGYDWLAVPLIPYLYAVDDLQDRPDSITPALAQQLRDTYRRQHLLGIAPDAPDGETPNGEWIQLVGSSFDRRIHVFRVKTTRAQDERLIAKLNDSRNRSHFNLFFNNCADFSRGVLRTLYPNTMPRNALADFGLTTPKHLARSLLKVGRKNPEMQVQVFDIPQLTGTTVRSHHVDGIAESLVRSKKYFVPIMLVSPTTAATLVAAYVGTGRFTVPKNAPLMPELVDQQTAPSRVDVMTLDRNILLGPAQQVAAENSSLACQGTPSSTQQATAFRLMSATEDLTPLTQGSN